MMANYANPETLVSTDWVDKNRGRDDLAIVEVDVDTNSFCEGHVPGAVRWSWLSQLCDQVVRDILPPDHFEALLGSSGIDNGTTVVLYGDDSNWFAAWAFWQLKIYGHKDVKLMNGGRQKWLAEGRDVSTNTPTPKTRQYTAQPADQSLRSFLADVRAASDQGSSHLVDVRGPREFSGQVLAPPGLPETCQRGGHIPGARSIPWGLVCEEDGTFKSVDDLQDLYESRGITRDKPVITYCRIGERSSHTWFVLKYLLGYPDVRNYDGSWTEWGNLVGAPIDRG